MFRFFIRAVPLLVLLMFLFSLTIPWFDTGRASSLAVLTVTRAPLRAVMGMWMLEAFGLIGLYLLVEGRSRHWWLDSLLAAWSAWIFRGPLLVVTLVLAAGKPQAPWFRLVVGWWVLYSICGLVLGALARHQAAAQAKAEEKAKADEVVFLDEPERPSVEPSAFEPPAVEDRDLEDQDLEDQDLEDQDLEDQDLEDEPETPRQQPVASEER